ncbi:MAG: GNAT family N-acetyltransferase [Desulfosarcinaceae bacterium]|jgi:spermidine synthase
MLSLDLLISPSAEQIGGVAHLYAETGWWPDAEDHPELVSRVIQGSCFFMVAREGDDIVGMGRAVGDGVSDAYIQDITVTASRRGEGIATRLVSALIDHLKKRGIDWIGLIAKGGAGRVYARCGFRPMKDAVPMRYFEK